MPTGDKSLPPKLELSDSIPPLIHSEADPEPPTLRPIDATPDCDDKAAGQSPASDGELPELLSSAAPRLNGYARDPLLEGDVSVVATSTLAEAAAGPVGRRTAVLFRKSKTAAAAVLHKPEAADGEDVEQEGSDGAGGLGSKSFLSVVIPRLETLLHKRKRKHSGSQESEEEGAEHEEEEGESPVKQLNTGESPGLHEMHEAYLW